MTWLLPTIHLGERGVKGGKLNTNLFKYNVKWDSLSWGHHLNDEKSLYSKSYHNPYKKSKAGQILNGKYCLPCTQPCYIRSILDGWFRLEITATGPNSYRPLNVTLQLQGGTMAHCTELHYINISPASSLPPQWACLYFPVPSTDIYQVPMLRCA